MYKAVDVNNVYKAFFKTIQQNPRNPRHNIGLSSALKWSNHPGVIVAVDRVSFSIERGEIFGLLGAHGSGKSTIIRLLAGLLPPDEGEIRIFGYNLASHPYQIQSQINNVSGQASFFRNLTPLENLIYCARISGQSALETRIQAQELLERIGLSYHDSKKPLSVLSHAVLQKIRIVHALLSCPRLLLLDEPITGLDQDSKQNIQRIIQEYNQIHGTTVFLTLSDRLDAEQFCGRIAGINAGKLVDEYPAQIKKQDDTNDPIKINPETSLQERSECIPA